jgi:hypothetical protein
MPWPVIPWMFCCASSPPAVVRCGFAIVVGVSLIDTAISPVGILGGVTAIMDAVEMNRRLPAWWDGPTKRALVGFLQGCVQGPEAVAPDERVAAFDNDGTVACEKPLTALAAFLLDHDGRPAAGPGAAVVGSGHRVMREVASRFAGQTTEA